MLLHNDAGGPEEAARRVLELFGGGLVGPVRTGLDDLSANFADGTSQGPGAYASQMLIDHPELDRPTVVADSIVAVRAFYRMVTGG